MPLLFFRTRTRVNAKVNVGTFEVASKNNDTFACVFVLRYVQYSVSFVKVYENSSSLQLLCCSVINF